jgi:hypothetical protein
MSLEFVYKEFQVNKTLLTKIHTHYWIMAAALFVLVLAVRPQLPMALNGRSQANLIEAPQTPNGARGRVQVIQDGNNFYTVVADNGYPLRGESIFMDDATGSTTDGFALSFLSDDEYWLKLRDDFHLNTVRLYMMRPPQNWSGGPGNDCFPPNYRCHALDYLLDPPRTALDIMDDVVDKAAELGMYIVVDYHPVGGYNAQDALDWWTIVAPRYKDRTHVIYEAINEPVGWNAGNYTDTDVQFQEDLYAHIRALAPDTHIIMWSFANCNGPMKDKIDLGPDINYSNASGSCHPYSFSLTDVNAVRSTYPLIYTEIGDSNVMQSILEAEVLGISWLGLNGMNTLDGFSPNGFLPNEVTWPADPGATTAPTVSTPNISPNTGPFIDMVDVTITTDTGGAEIRYTLNGSTPTAASTLYSSPINLTETTTVKAIGLLEGYNPSAVASKTYIHVSHWVFLPLITTP